MDSSKLKALGAEGGTTTCPDTLRVATTENGDDIQHQAVPGDTGAEGGPNEMLNW